MARGIGGLAAGMAALAALVVSAHGAAAATTVTITNSGPRAVTVAPGDLVAVELTGTVSLGTPHPWSIPVSSNPAVLTPLSGSTDAQAATHARFRATAPGRATLQSIGPSGIICPGNFSTPGPGCVGVSAALMRVEVTVQAGGIVAPQTGAGPAVVVPGGVAAGAGVVLVTAAVAARRRGRGRAAEVVVPAPVAPVVEPAGFEPAS